MNNDIIKEGMLSSNLYVDVNKNNTFGHSTIGMGITQLATMKDWNVVSDAEFKRRIDFVFDNVANALSNTLGPYGSTTIIEKFGEMHVTKDGWQVLKKIYFDDLTNQNIMQLLFNIAAQVVIKVGDGSTSSIMAANNVFKILNGSSILEKCRPKDFIDKLTKVVGLLCETISKNATKINSDDFEEIYRLAMVSTNGDTNVSQMIHDIYKQTNNPSIDFVKGRGKDTTYEIIEGYKSNISYIDAIFAQNDEGSCTLHNPIILLFDHKIEREIHFDNIIKPALQKAMAENRRLLVVAPHYDKFLLNYLGSNLNLEFKSTGTSQAVYTRVGLLNNLYHILYSDFAVMCGATIITEANIRDLLNNDEPIVVEDFLGACNTAVINDKSTLISGFSNRNETMYNKHVAQAVYKYEEAQAKQGDLAIVSLDLYDLKQRISKLRGKMGIISVGGYSTLERTASFDLVEDAVKACESAYTNGYNLGGNLSIILACEDEVIKNSNLDDVENEIVDIIKSAFRNVFTSVLRNKTHDVAFIKKTIDESIEKRKTFNLITNEYDDNIINSCKTDIEILKATTSIVSLLISSNQYLSIKVSN